MAVLDVLEHFAEPLRFLTELRTHLSPGGRLLVQVPNWDSLLVRLEGDRSSVVAPGHWSYFTPRTLPALLARSGFRVEHRNSRERIGPDPASPTHADCTLATCAAAHRIGWHARGQEAA